MICLNALASQEYVNRHCSASSNSSTSSSVATSPELETTEEPVAVAESLPHSLVAEDEGGGGGDEADGSTAHPRRRRKSSRQSRLSGGAQQQNRPQGHHRIFEPKQPLDDFTKLLVQDDARLLVDLLKLAVTGKSKRVLERGGRHTRISSANKRAMAL